MSSSASSIPSLAAGFLGAVVGASATPGQPGGMLLGALAGYAVARSIELTRQMDAFERETARLAVRLKHSGGGAPASAPAPGSVEPTVSMAAKAVDIEIRPEPPAESVEAGTASRWELEPPTEPTPEPVAAPVIGPLSGTGMTGIDAPAGPTSTVGRSQPGPIEGLFDAVRRYFTDGNTLVRSGVVVLLFGVAFLLRYAAEHTHLPIELRLTTVAVGAMALTALGWRWRRQRPGYALALQGAGVGILYLVVFAAFRWYALLPAAVAFPLLAATAAASVVLAVVQNSQPFAVLSVFGGFLAPLLASTGTGSHVALFSYYTVLDLGILAMLWFRPWRVLGVAGFATTFLISTWWGTLRYGFEDFLTTEPFLVLFLAIFLVITIRSTLRSADADRHHLDVGLLFANPLVAFGLQAALLGNRLLPLAFSAVALGGVYIGLAYVLRLDRSAAAKFLGECFLALGVVFVTLAVPLAISGASSATVWALEGLALTWVGCRHDHPRGRWFGAILALLAIGLWLLRCGNVVDVAASVPPGLVNGLLVGLATIATSLVLNRYRNSLGTYERQLVAVLFVLGALAWTLCGVGEIGRLVAPVCVPLANLAFVALSALAAGLLYAREPYTGLRYAAFCLLPFMALVALNTAMNDGHPSAYGGWLVWPASFAIVYFLLRRLEEADRTAGFATLHAVTIWLLSALLAGELSWQIREYTGGAGVWSHTAFALVPAGTLALIVSMAGSDRWPMKAWRDAYLYTAGFGLTLFLGVWALRASFVERGDAAPLAYVPLFNPLDVTLLCVWVAVLRYFLALRRAGLIAARASERDWVSGLALMAFVTLNGMLLRALSQLGGIPYTAEAMLRSGLVQTAVSIFWAVLALSTMLVATRIRHRPTWMTGATLLVIVVAKLFLVDAASIGTIDRIVSFIGVGLLMLAVGYFLPLPPAAAERS